MEFANYEVLFLCCFSGKNKGNFTAEKTQKPSQFCQTPSYARVLLKKKKIIQNVRFPSGPPPQY